MGTEDLAFAHGTSAASHFECHATILMLEGSCSYKIKGWECFQDDSDDEDGPEAKKPRKKLQQDVCLI